MATHRRKVAETGTYIEDLEDGTSRIELTQGGFALVDTQDVELVIQLLWRLGTHGYAVSKDGRTLMHRLIMGAADGVQVDHINHDKLDNRRSNLRVVTRAQNAANQRKCKTKTTSSKYKGVCLHSSGRWRAHIQANKTYTFLGYYPDEESAARAYDARALELWGEYAHLNFTD